MFYHFSYVVLEYDSRYILDLFISIKFLIYFCFFCMVSKSNVITISSFKKIFITLLWIFLLRYLIGRVLGEPRPSLYTENNFELCFLLMLYLTAIYYKLVTFKNFVLIGFIIIISGSRSAILGFFIIYLYQFKPWQSNSFTNTLFKISLAIIVVSAIGGMILSRMSSNGLEGVDRYVFLMVFIENIHHWDILKYLIGNPPLTPLYEQSCTQLSFYKDLFGRGDPTVCYPVILHSFWLRVILEHGFLFIGLIFTIFIMLFSFKGYDKGFTLFLFAIVAINGLSVSAFNSSFVSLGLLLILLINNKVCTTHA